MYQRARKFAAAMGDAAAFVELAELQLEAYVVAMNALALVDPKSQWVTLPITAETGHEVRALGSGAPASPGTEAEETRCSPVRLQPRKRRRLSKHIPEDKYALGNRDSEVVELKDMQYEYALIAARVELAQRDPTTLSAGGEFFPHLGPPMLLPWSHTRVAWTCVQTLRCRPPRSSCDSHRRAGSTLRWLPPVPSTWTCPTSSVTSPRVAFACHRIQMP